MILTSENIREAVLILWGPGRLKEAARAVGCSERELRRWVNDGVMPQTRYAGPLQRAIEARAQELLRAIEPFAA
jgi:Sec-independent protein translocase protein TatA